MRLGKHVYCEKPLTHSVYEARLMRDTARRMKVATQMGNQGTSDSGLRENVEIIQAGMLGPVHEVHVWSNRPIWPQGIERPKETPAVPETLKWDLWLGPAAERPYNPAYLPFVWRGWVPFGTGALGDMGCHTLNMPYMALKLDNPISVEAEVFESPDPLESYPKKSIIRYAFPARGDMPPAKLTWYDGGLKPSPELLGRTELSGSGCAVIGEKGILLTGSDYGGGREFYPAERYADFTPPPQKLPRSPGHHEEWLRACKGGEPAMSNFDYAVGLTEMVLLGNLAIVTGERIYFDPARMTAINCPKADEYIHPTFRKGWTL
jgi:predicted dehydrogenase